jgi:hypothetical protein
MSRYTGRLVALSSTVNKGSTLDSLRLARSVFCTSNNLPYVAEGKDWCKLEILRRFMIVVTEPKRKEELYTLTLVTTLCSRYSSYVSGFVAIVDDSTFSECSTATAVIAHVMKADYDYLVDIVAQISFGSLCELGGMLAICNIRVYNYEERS